MSGDAGGITPRRRHRVEGPAVLVGPRLAYLLRRTWIDLHPKARDQRAHPDVVEQLAELKALARDVESGAVRLDEVAPEVAPAIAVNGDGATIAGMSRAQVAELLDCSPQNVSALAGRGTLPGRHDERGRLLFDIDEVEAFLERRAST